MEQLKNCLFYERHFSLGKKRKKEVVKETLRSFVLRHLQWKKSHCTVANCPVLAHLWNKVLWISLPVPDLVVGYNKHQMHKDEQKPFHLQRGRVFCKKEHLGWWFAVTSGSCCTHCLKVNWDSYINWHSQLLRKFLIFSDLQMALPLINLLEFYILFMWNIKISSFVFFF